MTAVNRSSEFRSSQIGGPVRSHLRDATQGIRRLHGGEQRKRGDGGAVAGATVLPILLAVSAGHFLNDTMQSALLSIYPLLKDRWRWTSSTSASSR